MIYRKRVTKSNYSIGLTPQFLKVELGKRVFYFSLPYYLRITSKGFYTLTNIKDNQGSEIVSHVRLRDRVTVYRKSLKPMAEAMEGYYGSRSYHNAA